MATSQRGRKTEEKQLLSKGANHMVLFHFVMTHYEVYIAFDRTSLIPSTWPPFKGATISQYCNPWGQASST